jgi:branched-chain amino acid transport system substrate-binding protein
MCLLASACGTRLHNSAFLKAAGGGQSGPQGQEPLAGGVGAVTDQGGGATAAGGGGSTAAGGGSGPSSQAGGGAAARAASPGSAGGSAGGAGGPGNTASDQGVTATSIRVGNITAIGGAFGPEAFQVSLRGVRVFFQAINDRGGINGRKLSLSTCDDREDGSQDLACAIRLNEQDKVFALLANNSDATARSASYEYKNNIPDIGFPLNNGYDKYPNMYSIYGNQHPRDGKQVGVNGTRYLPSGIYRWFKQERHVDKAAFFFYTIPVSQQAAYAEENGAKLEGIATTYEGGGSHAGENPAAPSFDTDVVNMKAAGVNAVFDAIDTPANQKLCAAMDRQGFTVAAKVSTVEVWGDLVKDWTAPCRSTVYVGGVGAASYADQANPGVAQFRSEFAKYCPGCPLHQWSIDAWAAARMLADGIGSMGANVTRVGLEKWLDGLNQYTNHGLVVPVDYQKVDFSKPRTDHFVVAQWQDAARTFATVAPLGTSYVVPWYGTPSSDDGS